MSSGGDAPSGFGDGDTALGGSAGESSAGESSASGQAGADDGASNGGSPTAGAGPLGDAGQSQQSECAVAADCGEASPCWSVSCTDGVCGQAPLGEHSACTGGTCDGAGNCKASTCDSKQKDGDETSVDCGGSCGTCANGEGCMAGADCKSGVCTNQKCLPSGCTDGVKNGTETDVDCGGSCSTKCALGKGCAVVSDCAVTAGDLAVTVRCLQQTCTSTKPPASGIRYYQDFDPSRLSENASQCGASDDICLRGNGPAFPMHGLTQKAAAKALTKSLLFTSAGAVGSGGKFDGSYCLTRLGTSLSFNDASALTVMGWVKTTRSASPWESAVAGGLNHYFLAVDANPAAERFLAALATTQATSFSYTRATSVGQIPSAEWHHVALVYDTAAASMAQYVDGVKLQSRTQTGTITTGAVDVFIGCRKDSALGQFFIGTLDELVFYVRALTAAELSDYVRRTKTP